eukprot:6213795-Pleurochrysis_carterae.AAC.5
MDSRLDTASATATVTVFPGETPTKVELRRFLDQFLYEGDPKGHGTLLRGEIPPTAVEYTPPNLDDSIPELPDLASASGQA